MQHHAKNTCSWNQIQKMLDHLATQSYGSYVFSQLMDQFQSWMKLVDKMKEYEHPCRKKKKKIISMGSLRLRYIRIHIIRDFYDMKLLVAVMSHSHAKKRSCHWEPLVELVSCSILLFIGTSSSTRLKCIIYNMATKHMQLQWHQMILVRRILFWRCFMLRIVRHFRLSQLDSPSKRCCGPKSYNHIGSWYWYNRCSY